METTKVWLKKIIFMIFYFFQKKVCQKIVFLMKMLGSSINIKKYPLVKNKKFHKSKVFIENDIKIILKPLRVKTK